MSTSGGYATIPPRVLGLRLLLRLLATASASLRLRLVVRLRLGLLALARRDSLRHVGIVTGLERLGRLLDRTRLLRLGGLNVTAAQRLAGCGLGVAKLIGVLTLPLVGAEVLREVTLLGGVLAGGGLLRGDGSTRRTVRRLIVSDDLVERDADAHHARVGRDIGELLVTGEIAGARLDLTLDVSLVLAGLPQPLHSGGILGQCAIGGPNGPGREAHVDALPVGNTDRAVRLVVVVARCHGYLSPDHGAVRP